MILFRHFKTKGRITLAALIRIQILTPGFVLNRYKPEGPSAGQDFHCSASFPRTMKQLAARRTFGECREDHISCRLRCDKMDAPLSVTE